MMEGPVARTGKKRPISAGIPLDPTNRETFNTVRARGGRATCFFNNKGGVGKTTLVANLGAEFALNFGAKVLVVDADPQCNLTQYVLGGEESLEIYAKPDPQSVFSVIRPLSLGKGYSHHLAMTSASSKLPLRPKHHVDTFHSHSIVPGGLLVTS